MDVVFVPRFIGHHALVFIALVDGSPAGLLLLSLVFAGELLQSLLLALLFFLPLTEC